MIVRPARAADSNGIAAVHVSAWRAAYRGIVPQRYLDELSIGARERTWAYIFEQRRSETLVAESSGQIIGFVSFGKSRDEHASSAAGEIYAIYVAAEHWSKGVGRALWNAALARLHVLGFASAVVWVLAANQRAIRFYERAGSSLVAGSAKSVEIGGEALLEVRYDIVIPTRRLEPDSVTT